MNHVLRVLGHGWLIGPEVMTGRQVRLYVFVIVAIVCAWLLPDDD